MKKIIYIGLMLATIGFTASSCKKEETPEPQATLPTNNNNGNNNNNNNNDTATLSLVKTMKVIDGNTQIFFYTFTYDSQGRMSQIVYENTTSSVIKTTNLTWKPDSLLVERIEGTTPPTYSQYTLPETPMVILLRLQVVPITLRITILMMPIIILPKNQVLFRMQNSFGVQTMWTPLSHCKEQRMQITSMIIRIKPNQEILVLSIAPH